MGAGAHDKSYEASWHQKQDDCKERPHASGLSQSYFTSEIKETNGKINVQVSKYPWDLNTLPDLTSPVVRNQQNCSPRMTSYQQFGNFFRNAIYKVFSPHEPDAQTTRPGHNRPDQHFPREGIQQEGFWTSLTFFIGLQFPETPRY